MTVRYVTLVNLLAADDPFSDRIRPYDPQEHGAERIPYPEYPTWQDKSEPMAKHIVECPPCATRDGAARRRAGHAHVVGDHRAREAELTAQLIADPPARQARGRLVVQSPS